MSHTWSLDITMHCSSTPLHTCTFIIITIIIFKPRSTKPQAGKAELSKNNNYNGVLLNIKSALEGDCVLPFESCEQVLEQEGHFSVCPLWLCTC